MSNAFLSIVEPPTKDGTLLVRARAVGDIEQVFPGAKVALTPARDYRFRAFIPRDEVAEALAAEVRRINYGNFKGSVRDWDRHDAYMDVWSAMHRYQQRRAPKDAGRAHPVPSAPARRRAAGRKAAVR